LEIGEEINGIDPLKPVFREKAEAPREMLLSIQDWFKVLQVDSRTAGADGGGATGTTRVAGRDSSHLLT
jgi:hypothetical protein